MTCRLCGARDPEVVVTVHEMMFGRRDSFEYFQCGRCGTLQIADAPSDLSLYYPHDYYSLADAEGKRSYIALRIRRLRDTYAVYSEGLLGRLLYRRHPNPALRSLARVRVDENSRILDVGCGAGTLLRKLYELGVSQVSGIDPYVQNDVRYGDMTLVRKQTLDETDGTWDVIMLHHVFEHLTDPEGAIKKIGTLLARDGVCIIRSPAVPCQAWTEYGVDWVQIDAPRHICIPSRMGLEAAAKNGGMRLTDSYRDSTAFQFWGSELYRAGIPLREAQPGREGSSGLSAHFSKRQIRAFERRAALLNAQGSGDQAVYYLKRA